MKPSFSFLYNGEHLSSDTLIGVQNGNDTVYTLPDGLVLTVRAEYEPAYCISKWTPYWENPTDHDSGIITELRDCDIAKPFAPLSEESDDVVLYITTGANVREDDYWIDPHIMKPGDHEYRRCICGRSGMGISPFFEFGQGKNVVIVALGWTGQWEAHFNAYEDCFRMKAGIQDVSFSMHPGEHFRTASVTVMEYQGDRMEAHNLFRRYIRDCLSPFAKSRGVRGEQCPFSAIFWGGINSEELLKRWKGIIGAELPLDTCWIDAGWYEPLRSTTVSEQLNEWGRVGDWRINTFYHPDGYRDVVSYLTEHNVGFMVWMEPERMKKSVKLWTKYIPSENEEDDTKLVALNDDEACDDVIELVSSKIREMSLKVYRQDFNMDPYPFWKRNDLSQPNGETTRRGTTEIHYINNMYRFWDTLLERFPQLLIDDCCGGGHRIDIEMLSRSVPLWRSDFQCTWNSNSEANQNQNAWSSFWFPYTGIGYGPALGDTYQFRSCWTNGLTVRAWEHVDPSFDFGAPGKPLDWAKKHFDQFARLRRYFSEDYYPLIMPTRGTDTWLASQYHCPRDETGIVLAFRRPDCPDAEADVTLRGLNPDALYEFTDEDSGSQYTVTGKQAENIRLTIAEKRGTQLLSYRKVQS